jgi:hypothetical protein
MSHHHDNLYTILGKLENLQASAKAPETKVTMETVYETVESTGSVLEGVNKVESKLQKQFAEAKADKDYDKNGKIESEKDEVIGSRRKAAGLDEQEQVDEMFAFDTKPGKDKGRPDELARRATLGKNPLAKGSPHASEYKTKDKYGNAYNIAGPKGQLPEEQVDEHFFYDTPAKGGQANPSKDKLSQRGGRNTPVGDPSGYKAMVKGQGPFGNSAKKMYGINGPKGALPEEREGGPTIPGTQNKAKSRYNPSNKPAPVKKLDKPTDKFDKNLKEGINFAEMMKETDSNVSEMMNELQKDINAYKQTGHCSDRLEAFLKVHHHGKKVMDEAVPKGPSFAPQDAIALDKPTAPFVPSRTQGPAPSMTSRAVSAAADIAKKGIDLMKGPDDEQLLRDLRTKSTMEEAADAELEKLAELAGLTMESRVSENTSFDMGSVQDSNINISTNMSTNGDKNVTITASGDQAAELLQMLKIAGLGDTGKAQELQAFGSDFGDEECCDEPTEMDILSPEMDMDEEANSPDEEYFSMKASTMNPGEGDFGEKNMYGGPGDNRMTQQPNRPSKPVYHTDESVLALESSLAAEYESIKKAK